MSSFPVLALFIISDFSELPTQHSKRNKEGFGFGAVMLLLAFFTLINRFDLAMGSKGFELFE